MNTSFPRDTVATVPTVYGIETTSYYASLIRKIPELQQYLPFTVLKLVHPDILTWRYNVATVPTVYGIETNR